jgi:hypothetical protein
MSSDVRRESYFTFSTLHYFLIIIIGHYACLGKLISKVCFANLQFKVCGCYGQEQVLNWHEMFHFLLFAGVLWSLQEDAFWKWLGQTRMHLLLWVPISQLECSLEALQLLRPVLWMLQRPGGRLSKTQQRQCPRAGSYKVCGEKQV